VLDQDANANANVNADADADQSVITVLAPAKINLALHLLGQQSSGYHDLESLVVFANIGDVLSARFADVDSLHISGPFAQGLKTEQSNLVSKAVASFRSKWPNALGRGIKISLEKNLPISAGIGGGSADAAAALHIMTLLSGVDIPTPELSELALGLGADVPLCLFSKTCIVRGIGEVVQPLYQFPTCHVVLINPLKPVSTADIFKKTVSKNNSPLPPLPSNLVHNAVLGLWMRETRNDLEPAAFEILPEIADIGHALRKTSDCFAARMSGSGATVFGLYGSSAAAHQSAHDMRETFPHYWVTTAPLIRPNAP
jgi:4-diphosphocytidyl-2-C-methyl-D-erythritol kinase